MTTFFKNIFPQYYTIIYSVEKVVVTKGNLAMGQVIGLCANILKCKKR